MKSKVILKSLIVINILSLLIFAAGTAIANSEPSRSEKTDDRTIDKADDLESCGRVLTYIVYSDKVEVIVVRENHSEKGNRGWEFLRKEGFSSDAVVATALKAMEFRQKVTFCVPNVLDGRKAKRWYYNLHWKAD